MLLAFSALAAAQAAGAAQPVVSFAEPQSVVSYLHRNGYQAKLSTGSSGPMVESGISGTKWMIFFLNCENGRNCKDIQFYAGWVRRENPVSIAAVNEFNKNKRFAKAYIDEDNDPVIEMDLVFLDQQMSESLFAENIDLWGSLVADFIRHIAPE